MSFFGRALTILAALIVSAGYAMAMGSGPHPNVPFGIPLTPVHPTYPDGTPLVFWLAVSLLALGVVGLAFRAAKRK